MTVRALIALALGVTLVVTLVLSLSAQAERPMSRALDPLSLVAPAVVSGSDLGFRVESVRNDIAVGKLVVRINGQWIDAQIGSNGLTLAR